MDRTGLAATFGTSSTRLDICSSSMLLRAACAIGLVLIVALPCQAAPVIDNQPSDVVACEGEAASFTVTAHSNNAGTLTFQWRRGTTSLVNGGNIFGATSPTLIISPVTLADAATNYNVVVTQTGDGSLTSHNASLTVNAAPAAPTNVQANPSSLCGSGSSTLSANVPAGQTVDWYSGSCGDGNFEGTGTSILVSLSTTTTYYAQARNTTTDCVSMTCGSVTVSVHPVPDCTITAASQVPANSTGNTASVPDAGPGTTYAWSISPAQGAITSGQGTRSIVYNAGNGPTVTLNVTITTIFNCMCSNSLNVPVNSGPATISMAFDKGCYKPGDTVLATLSMSGLGTPAAGFQAFLAYDTSNLTFVTWQYTTTPFGLWVINTLNGCGNPDQCVNPSPGVLNVASGIDQAGGQMPSQANALLVTLTFTIPLNAANCNASGLLTYRAHTPPTRITDAFGNELLPLTTIAAPTVTIDGTPPVITPGSINSCYPTQGAAETAALNATVAHDNCTPDNQLVKMASTNGTCNAVITVTVTDCAGNSSSTQYNTHIDNDVPVISCPPAVTVQCTSAVPANATNLASFVAQGGSASDACFVSVSFVSDVISNQTCANRYTITRTYQAADQCGHTANCTQTITVNDTTPPTITCPPAVTVQCAAAVPANATNLATFTAQGGSASDNCGPPTVTFEGDVVSGQTCTNRFTITRTYKATDACGQFVTCTQTINVNDTTAPVITCPGAVTVQCAAAVPANATNRTTFLALGNGAAVTDNCDPTPVVTFQGDVISNQSCPNRFTVTRTYRATDSCGNFAECTQTITVNDTTAPVITCPGAVTVQCAAAVPANATDRTSFLALGNGAAATDNCDPAPAVAFVSDVISNQTCANRFTITRRYRATDSCGNFADCTQTITVNDNTAPVIACPGPVTVQCSTDIPANATDRTSFLALGNGAAVSDNCDPTPVVTWQGDTTSNVICFNHFTVTRKYRATDSCGNFAECNQTITVNDTTQPSITCPANVTVNADAGGCTAVVNPGTAVATDNCAPAPTVVGVRSDNGGNSVTTPALFAAPYPSSTTTTITWTATDACNNTRSCAQTVTVNAVNIMNVSLELSPTINTGGSFPQTITRCITFQLWNCPAAAPAATVNQTITFTRPSAGSPSRATNVSVSVPCGAYTCVTARDKLHTLRRTLGAADGFGIAALQYQADFVTPGKQLIGGNLNDDAFIDILDFGVFTAQFNKHYDGLGHTSNSSFAPDSGNTDCSTPFPHADISGDGLVFTADFTFIQINFLTFRDPNCCGAANIVAGGGPSEEDGPVTSITVNELRARHMDDLVVADLNHDGVLDQQDIVAWMQGARPSEPTTEAPPVQLKPTGAPRNIGGAPGAKR